MVGIRWWNGETEVVQIAPDGAARVSPLNGWLRSTPSMHRILTDLTRKEQRNRQPGAAATQLNRETVAVVQEATDHCHGGTEDQNIVSARKVFGLSSTHYEEVI